MGVNLSEVSYQCRRLDRYSQELKSLDKQLNTLKISLGQAWKAKEYEELSNKIDRYRAKLLKAYETFDSLSEEIYEVAIEIKEEEEKRKAKSNGGAISGRDSH